MNARADDIELDVDLAGTLEEVLLHARGVDDADWHKAQTMFEQELGPRKVPEKTTVVVSLNTDAPWRDRWNQGEQLSGQQEVDDLIRAYNIQVVRSNRFSNGDFHLIVPREVNGFALENRIAKVPGFSFPISGWDLYAWGNSLKFGSGVSVRPDKRLGGWSLRVAIGWSDCPSGCIYGRSFSFEIDTSGETRLVQTKGDPLP